MSCPAPGVAAAAGSSGGRLSAVIRYTEYGIPHIVADDYAGLGFGSGWAQARDQVCALADAFLTVRGERSLWFGPGLPPDPQGSFATTNLASDLYHRGVREAGTVERLREAPAPTGPSRAAADLGRGWAAGYNAWLRAHRITDPSCAGAGWVRPVTETDVAALDRSLTVLLGEGRGIDGIAAAGPPESGSAPATPEARPAPDLTAPQGPAAAKAVRGPLPTGRTGPGSNAVAFHGSTTDNGRGLLLGNPHFPWHGAQRFWQSHQSIPGELDVMGASLLGTAAVSIGYTADVAWSHTVATGVPMNLYELALDPSDPTSYLVDGRPEPMTRRTVTVAVKEGPPVTRTQWWTRYGPVITALDLTGPLPWTRARAYALNDPNAAHLRGTDAALALARAHSTDEVLKGLNRTQGIPWANTIAADAAGHTLFTQSQVLPRVTEDIAARCSTPLGTRVYPATGLAVLDGSRSDCALGSDPYALQPGIFGPGALPVLKDAPYAENSNDSAWLTNAERPLTGYERVFGTTGTPLSLRTRGALRDVGAMAGRGHLTVADLQRHQFADSSLAGDLAGTALTAFCTPVKEQAAQKAGTRPADTAEACRVLTQWDRTVNTDSRGALLFDRFWRGLVADTTAEERWTVPFSPTDPLHTPRALNTSSPALPRALERAVAELRAAGIPLDAPWGDTQFVVRGGTRIPIPGGSAELGVWNVIDALWDPAAGGYSDVASGTSYLQAVGWDDTGCPDAKTLLAYSQSADPTSPHHSDQTRLLSNQQWITSRFCEKDILQSPDLEVLTITEQN
ncbi:penicillin acylase family protein [Streptomyces sp. BE20]|uniref:penicillin acylase family protein n=1 Tax=unclassified Streptomyces TaxID=2593676 RepID=UPI002E794EFE|nr:MULTISPECIES: penicillin acylase family protein [unclassified Streptomyces]MED7947568.1 penicillin acylase family protein [Streptomyces sp. BE303]MEE1828066.1 penicillin acylase family protein [Streptomyces sp. BE20]